MASTSKSRFSFIRICLMPTVSLKQAVIKWIKRGNYCLLLGLWLWKDLIESNETIAHALRYIIPFGKGYNNPKHERIAAILGECNCPDYVQKMISNALLKDRTLYSVHFYIGTLEFGYKDR